MSPPVSFDDDPVWRELLRRLAATEAAAPAELSAVMRTARRLFKVAACGLFAANDPHSRYGELTNADIVVDGSCPRFPGGFFAKHAVRGGDGRVLAWLCLVDPHPRAFDETDRASLADLAALAQMYLRQPAQRALRDEPNRHEYILQNVLAGFAEVDERGRIVAWNHSAQRIFGWSAEEAIGRDPFDLIVPPLRRQRYARALAPLLAGAGERLRGRRMVIMGMRRGGESFPLEIILNTSRLDERIIVHAFMHDVGRRKADERALREMASRLRTITDNLPAMVAYLDRDLRYRFHNRAYHDWFGVAEDGLIGVDARIFWGASTYAQLRPVLTDVLQGRRGTVEYQLHGKQGPMWFYANLVPEVRPNGKVAGFYLLAQDVSERKRRFQQVEHDATHDALTGLPNRRALMQRMNQAMARARESGDALVLLFMDLDGFKRMNDTLGHEFGDEVLRLFAAQVSSAVRDSDFLGRLAGDEFVLLIEGIHQAHADVAQIAQSVLERVCREQEVLNVVVELSTSIGAAIHSGEDEETAQEWLARADTAMYRAKAKGRSGWSF